MDLLQTIDVSKKTGVLYLTSNSQRGAVYFRDGALVDAELGSVHGERAVYRAMLWSEGNFKIDFRSIRREGVMKTSTQAVLIDGIRYIDEWGRLLDQLPPLNSVLEIDESELIDRLSEIPDEVDDVLKRFDGNTSMIDVVYACDGNNLEVLTAISKLYFEGNSSRYGAEGFRTAAGAAFGCARGGGDFGESAAAGGARRFTGKNRVNPAFSTCFVRTGRLGA